MRIGVVVGPFPALSETFVLDHVIGLLEHGHDVRVLADRPDETNRSHELDVPKELSGLTTYRRSADGSMSRALGLISVHARSHIPRAITEGLIRPGGPAGRFATAAEIEGLRRLGDVELIHCHFGPIGERVAHALALMGRQTPVVTTFHGYDLTRYLRDAEVAPYANLLRTGRLFLPISEFFRDRLLGLGAPAERTVVNRVGIDTSRLTPSAVERPETGPMRVLMVGRSVEKKGFEYGLRGFAEALERGVSAEMVVVGDGPLLAELTSLANALGIDGSVEFTGRQGRDGVLACLREANVLMVPSVEAHSGDMEGIPVVLMEAMSVGLAVIATRHSGIPELVHDDVTGLLVPERDSVALADRLVVLAIDPGLRHRLGRDARHLVVQQHDLRATLGQLEVLYSIATQNRATMPERPS